MNSFNWRFPTLYSSLGEVLTPVKCRHRGPMYSAWDVVGYSNTYANNEKGEKGDILSLTSLEKCSMCGEYRLVTYDLKNNTVTIKKQVVEDPDVA